MTSLTAASEIDVVCLGILVADAIARPIERLPARGKLELVEEISLHGGGCALNTATGLARLGLNVAVAGKVGRDALGDFLISVLDERGLDRRAVVRDEHAPTSSTVVLVDGAGERTFLHLPGANGHLVVDELDRELIFRGRALHVGGALVMPGLDGQPMADLLADAQAGGLFTCLDTVWDANARWSRIQPSLPHVDLFAPSIAEAQAITGLDDPVAVASALRARGAGEVALKLGSRGSFISGSHFEGYVEPVAVDSLDETGAGDAFVAALLFARLSGWPLEQAARLANAAGALATTAVGAAEAMPKLDQLLSFAQMEIVA